MESISAWMKADSNALDGAIADTKLSARPETKLFSVGQIALATFLGTPIAGTLLIARNYQVLGKNRAAWLSIGLGIVATAVFILLAILLPKGAPGSLLAVLSIAGTRQLGTHFQGRAISAHEIAGGRKGSWAITVALGLGALACVLVAVVSFVFALAFIM